MFIRYDKPCGIVDAGKVPDVGLDMFSYLESHQDIINTSSQNLNTVESECFYAG